MTNTHDETYLPRTSSPLTTYQREKEKIQRLSTTRSPNRTRKDHDFGNLLNYQAPRNQSGLTSQPMQKIAFANRRITVTSLLLFSIKRQMYATKGDSFFYDKIGYVGSVCYPLCSWCSSCVSPSPLPPLLHLSVLSPFPFSLPFCPLSFIVSEASRDNPMSAGVIQRHLFSSYSGKSSSPLSVLIVRLQNHKSNTSSLSPFYIL